MNYYQREIIQEIINTQNTLEKVEKYKYYKAELEDIKILLFDEKKSNVEGFEEFSVGKYYLCSLANYCNLWILDNSKQDEEYYKLNKKAYFDINMISRIDELINGKSIDDKCDLINFLDQLKKSISQNSISTAVIERMSKSYDERLFKRSIESFYFFDNKLNVNIISKFLNRKKVTNFYESQKKIGLSMNQDNVLNRQYDFILCLLAKAIIIKADKKCEKKIDALVEFALKELKCIMINETYLLCLYLKNDISVTKKTFAKFHSEIKNGIENAVRNTAWDIYHARLIEQNMEIYKSTSGQLELPYFVTNDKGVKDYWEVNPRKMMVIENNRANSIYERNIGDLEDMLVDSHIYEEIIDVREQEKRKIEIHAVDIESVKKGLLDKLKDVRI